MSVATVERRARQKIEMIGTAGRTLATRQAAITLVAVAVFLLFSKFANNFLTIANLLDIARGYSFVVIVAIGMTYLLIAGELDLSVGSLYGLSSVILAWLLVSHDFNIIIAIIVVLFVGGCVGFINGFVTTVVGVPSFIVTLGMLSLLKGASLIISGGFPVDLFGEASQKRFHSVAAGQIGSVPAQAIWAVAFLIPGALILKLTPFGHHMYAVGGNLRAAHQAGMNVRFTKIACFVIIGCLAATVGILNAGWLESASPTTGTGFELTVIAAVIIGGTALYGGEGSVYGTLVGAIILGMLDNGLVLLGVDANWTIVWTGAIVIVVGSINVLFNRTQTSVWINRIRAMSRKEAGAIQEERSNEQASVEPSHSRERRHDE